MGINEDQQLKISQHQAQVAMELQNPEFFDHFTLETLNNFAYRYFEGAQAAIKTHDQPHRYQVCARELGIKDLIKLNNPTLRDSLKQLVLNHPPAKVSLERRFMVEFESAQDGVVTVSAAISFGHPHHDYSPGTFVEKSTRFEYSEFLLLRNRLAALIEDVASLYG
jgi:hypothetical protein